MPKGAKASSRRERCRRFSRALGSYALGARNPLDAERLDMPALIAYTVGMPRRSKAEATQYTIRNVPKVVDRALRRSADRQGRSLNDVSLEALARGAGVEREATEHHDLDFLFGSWVQDPRVDSALADQRVIDEDLWT
jgi:hypothetical protein